MKISAVKELAQKYSIEVLKKQENRLLEGLPLEIEVIGDDEGEKLTHILGAIWVLETMQNNGMTLVEAIRAFTEKVRKSID